MQHRSPASRSFVGTALRALGLLSLLHAASPNVHAGEPSRATRGDQDAPTQQIRLAGGPGLPLPVRVEALASLPGSFRISSSPLGPGFLLSGGASAGADLAFFHGAAGPFMVLGPAHGTGTGSNQINSTVGSDGQPLAWWEITTDGRIKFYGVGEDIHFYQFVDIRVSYTGVSGGKPTQGTGCGMPYQGTTIQGDGSVTYVDAQPGNVSGGGEYGGGSGTAAPDPQHPMGSTFMVDQPGITDVTKLLAALSQAHPDVSQFTDVIVVFHFTTYVVSDTLGVIGKFEWSYTQSMTVDPMPCPGTPMPPGSYGGSGGGTGPTPVDPPSVDPNDFQALLDFMQGHYNGAPTSGW